MMIGGISIKEECTKSLTTMFCNGPMVDSSGYLTIPRFRQSLPEMRCVYLSCYYVCKTIGLTDASKNVVNRQDGYVTPHSAQFNTSGHMDRDDVLIREALQWMFAPDLWSVVLWDSDRVCWKKTSFF